MREIKFRGWNPMASKMVDLKASTPLAVDDVFSSLQPDGLYLPLGTNFIIQQFTGLQDSKGVGYLRGRYCCR